MLAPYSDTIRQLVPRFKATLAIDWGFDEDAARSVLESVLRALDQELTAAGSPPLDAIDLRHRLHRLVKEAAVRQRLSQLHAQIMAFLQCAAKEPAVWQQIKADAKRRAEQHAERPDFRTPPDQAAWALTWIRAEAAARSMEEDKGVVRSRLLKKWGQRIDVDEALQEAMCRIVSHGSLTQDFVSADSPTALFGTVADNCARELYRRTRAPRSQTDPRAVLVRVLQRLRRGDKLSGAARRDLRNPAVVNAIDFVAGLLSGPDARLLRRVLAGKSRIPRAVGGTSAAKANRIDSVLTRTLRPLESGLQLQAESADVGELESRPIDPFHVLDVAMRQELALERATVNLPDAPSVASKARRLRTVFVLRRYGSQSGKLLSQREIKKLLRRDQATISRWLKEARQRLAQDLRRWAARDPVLREESDLAGMPGGGARKDPSASDNFWLAAMLGATARLTWTREESQVRRCHAALEFWWTYRRFGQGPDGDPQHLPSLDGAALEDLLREAEADWWELLDGIAGGDEECFKDGREAVRDWVHFMIHCDDHSAGGDAVVKRLIRREL